MNIDQLYELYKKNPAVETDSRKIIPGTIFFALKGPNFNGNQYANQALANGAAYCIVDEETGIQDKRLIKVDDSLQTLQQLAKKHREQFDIPFLAITGTNGKTTTKELVHAVLSTKFKTYTTAGNLNNHIGIPLTILKIKGDAQMAVIEMGANHQKEIEGYCLYAMPTHGMITNCGKAHLEGFGGEEGVRKAKGELFDYLRRTAGNTFINNDYEYLVEMSKGIAVTITYGTTEADFVGGQIEADDEFLHVEMIKGAAIPIIHTHLVGGYNLPNVLAAVCVAKSFNVADDEIKLALENYIPANSRSQLIELNGNRVILDAYNANPSSMMVAVDNFGRSPGANKILVLGAMMELGTASINEHEALVNHISQYEWDKVVLVGKDYQYIPSGFLHFEDVSQARQWFQSAAITGAKILIKGSRSMQMEKILES